MVNAIVALVFMLLFFCLGVGVTLFVGWFMSERFARKPTQKEVKAYQEQAAEQETAWSEGFDSVEAYRKWREKGGEKT